MKRLRDEELSGFLWRLERRRLVGRAGRGLRDHARFPRQFIRRRIPTEFSLYDAGALQVEDIIDPAFLPFVFDRFRQADASSTRSHTGLGLGLSIVKHLVELHGGTIAAHSAGLGPGSSFRIALPLVPVGGNTFDSKEPREHPERTSEVHDGAGLEANKLAGFTILVDDELDGRTLVQRFLEECGARVLLAASAAEALAALDQSVSDVLVSDIGMTGQDGYALIKQVRALQASRARIPAVALTAYARTEDRVKTIGAGYQAHLSKPVEPIKLVATIRSLKSHFVLAPEVAADRAEETLSR
jgi:CheY-like chemotaxis protein